MSPLGRGVLQAAAHGDIPMEELRVVGDPVLLHGERTDRPQKGGDRETELVVNSIVGQ